MACFIVYSIIFSQLQSANSKATTSIKLRELITKEFKQTKRAELKNVSRALQLIDGLLWCGQENEIHIYSTNLHQQRVIKSVDIGTILGIAGVDDNKVAVAATRGLVIVDIKGNALLTKTWVINKSQYLKH